jgi:hypothetical protein
MRIAAVWPVFDHSQILCRAARLLISGLADGYDGVCRIERDMSRIEDEGDRVVHPFSIANALGVSTGSA